MGGTVLLFDLAKQLLLSAVSSQSLKGLDKLTTRVRVENSVENAIAQVIEPLEEFFVTEGLDKRQQTLLAMVCEDELKPWTQEPAKLFESSLDGQTLFDQMYRGRSLPRAILDEQMEHVYSMVFPRIAHLVCGFPPLLKLWEHEGWRESFRRFDEIALTLSDLSKKVDAISHRVGGHSDELLVQLRQSMLQRITFNVEIAGLRADRPMPARLEDMFVVPWLKTRDGRDDARSSILACTKREHLLLTRRDIRGLIYGAPGAGKSTWSQWLQFQELSMGNRLMIVARLRKYEEALPSLLSMVHDEVGSNWAAEIDATVLRSWIRAGWICIVLDGFDEVPPGRRDDIIKWIKELHLFVESCAILITSRPLTTSHLEDIGREWFKAEILPFDKDQTIDYMQRWYRFAPLLSDAGRDADVKSLEKQWREEPVIQPLLCNPLVLSTLLMVHHLDGELPQGRSKLYERYVNGMLGLRDDRYGIQAGKLSLTTAEKTRVLTRIALEFHLAQIEQAGDAEMKSIVGQSLRDSRRNYDVDEVLRVLRERSGLLVGPGTYSFVHKSIAEFLVASAVVDASYVDERGARLDKLRLYAERHNDRWNTVLFFWAGSVPGGDLEDFIDRVIDAHDDRSHPLAIGLIQDQIHRITSDWGKLQLAELLRTWSDTSVRDRHEQWITFWLSPIPMLSFDIRGIIRTSGDAFLLLSLMRHFELTWSDLLGAPNALLSNLWVGALASGYNSLEELRLIFQAGTELNVPGNYVIAGLQYALRSALTSSDPETNVLEILEAVRAGSPSYEGFFVIALLCFFSKDALEYHGLRSIQTKIDGDGAVIGERKPVDPKRYSDFVCNALVSARHAHVDIHWLRPQVNLATDSGATARRNRSSAPELDDLLP
ncbi:MAG: NACHT domain-containing protein, partial [Tepidisphaeraceae bacterium]